MKLEQNKSVYVIHNPEFGITKIGISSNADFRLISLQCAAGCELRMIYKTPPIEDAKTYETLIHEALTEKRKLGEWFNVDPEEAEGVVRRITSSAHEDKIVSAYLKGDSITAIAERNNVSRQAILNRLRVYGIYEEGRPIICSPSRHKERVVEDEAPSMEEDWSDIRFQDEVTTGRMTRVEANINFDGSLYEINIYIPGAGFIKAYSKDIQRAREYILHLKNINKE